MRQDVFTAFRSMSDDEFERTVALERAFRQGVAEAVAYERAMNAATNGVYGRWMTEANESGRDKIHRDYARLGLSDSQIRRLMAGLSK